MEKNKLIVSTSIILAASAGVIIAANGSNTNHVVLSGLAESQSYSLKIDSPIYSGSGQSGESYTFVQTNKGNNVKVKYNKLSTYKDNKQYPTSGAAINNFAAGSYIEIVDNDDIKGITGINSVIIKGSMDKQSSYVRVSYGWEEGKMMNHIDNIFHTSAPQEYTYNLPDSPSYIRIELAKYYYENYEVNLNEITINYSCIAKVDPYVIDNYVLDFEEDHFEVTRYKGTDTILEFPSEYQGKPITAIADNFSVDIGMNSLTNVTLPSSITSIGYRAFFDATELRTINLDNVDFIGEHAFLNCKKLGAYGEITVGASTIGQTAFGQSGLTYVAFKPKNNSLTCAGSLFWLCTDLCRVTFTADTVLKTDDQMFARCTSLYRVVLPKVVLDSYDRSMIQYYMFQECTSLTDLQYAGTVAEWNAIGKEVTSQAQWYKDIPTNKVKCSDGDAPIERIQTNE